MLLNSYVVLPLYVDPLDIVLISNTGKSFMVNPGTLYASRYRCQELALSKARTTTWAWSEEGSSTYRRKIVEYWELAEVL